MEHCTTADEQMFWSESMVKCQFVASQCVFILTVRCCVREDRNYCEAMGNG